MVPEFKLHVCCCQRALKAFGGGDISVLLQAFGSLFFWGGFFLSSSASSHLQGKDSPGFLCLIHMCRSTTWRTDSSIAWGWGSSLTHSSPLQPPHFSLTSNPPPCFPEVSVTHCITSAGISPQLLLNRRFLSLFLSLFLSVSLSFTLPPFS